MIYAQAILTLFVTSSYSFPSLPKSAWTYWPGFVSGSLTVMFFLRWAKWAFTNLKKEDSVTFTPSRPSRVLIFALVSPAFKYFYLIIQDGCGIWAFIDMQDSFGVYLQIIFFHYPFPVKTCKHCRR